MLTVKHIRADGAETIDRAERVIFYPPTAQSAVNPHDGGVVTAVGAISGGVDWVSGTVYVMNEHGSTVARYDLGSRTTFEVPDDDALGVSNAA